MTIKRDIGKEILEGIEEIKMWQRGQKKLKVSHISMPSASDVAKIRHELDLSQEAFAAFMGVSVATLRNWEQGRREPNGSARSLLLIAKKVPSAFLRAFKDIRDAAQSFLSIRNKFQRIAYYPFDLINNNNFIS